MKLIFFRSLTEIHVRKEDFFKQLTQIEKLHKRNMLSSRLLKPSHVKSCFARHMGSISNRNDQQAIDPHQQQAEQLVRLPPCQMENMMDIGARSIFEEDHDIFRSSVRRFMRDELAPNHARYEAQGQVDRELWNKLGEQGFLGVAISDEVGGEP